MFSTVLSAAICGLESISVRVEADVSDGMPMFSMVGFLSFEVKEARDRVRTALKNIGIGIPPKRITINLAPADLRKVGASFDLPIAVAVLASLGYIHQEYLDDVLIVGELSLNGEVNPVKGILPMIAEARKNGCKTCIISKENAKEGALVEGIDTIGVKNLKEVIEYLNNKKKIIPEYIDIEEIFKARQEVYEVDYKDVNGQESVKRAMEVAAAGMHNILMLGPPGSGKTMIAKRVPTILPSLSMEESMEISKIYSVAGLLPADFPLILTRPYRSPHHTITASALVGGGRIPGPGEVSLANGGVLFLDELTEFPKAVLEIMRQPLEDQEVHIARIGGTFIYPSNFMLVAAMNPCNCGYYPDLSRCSCTSWNIERYLNKISQPFLDRIDICIETPIVKYEELTSSRQSELSADIRKRVSAAHAIQRNRYKGLSYGFNSDLSGAGIQEFCKLGDKEADLLEAVYKKLNLSARAYHRIIKVARTIADLDGQEQINTRHISEAICYRTADKKFWMK